MNSKSLVIITALLFIILQYVKSTFVELKTVVKTDKERAMTVKSTLLFYVTNYNNPNYTYMLIKDKTNYWIYSTYSNEIYNLLDIYPSFNGVPIGFLVFNASSFNLPVQRETSIFYIYSTDGKLYNPIDMSHDYRSSLPFLPLEKNFASVDAISTSGKSFSIPKYNLRFYYKDGTYYQEDGCYESAGEGNKCYNSKSVYPTPVVDIYGVKRNNNSLEGISANGYIYRLVNGKWVKYINWNTLLIPIIYPVTVDNDDESTGIIIKGCEFQNDTPIFLMYQNNELSIVDCFNRKYNFLKLFRELNVLPVGGIIDFTVAGDGEYDYLVACTDEYLYSNIIPEYRRKISDFVNNPSYPYSNLISITSVKKWDQYTRLNKYYIVFVYTGGKWIEREYNISTNTIGVYGESDSTSKLWTSWVTDTIPNGKVFISAYNWTIFNIIEGNMYDNLKLSKIYSFNDKTVNFTDVLYCTKSNDGFKSSYCVGRNREETYQKINVSAFTDFRYSNSLPTWFINKYPELDVKFQLSSSTNVKDVHKKISIYSCIDKIDSEHVFAAAYDNSTSTCTTYSGLNQDTTYQDPNSDIYISRLSEPLYDNRFCLKGGGKYLYIDMTQEPAVNVRVKDVCISQVVVTENSTEQVIDEHKKSLGSMWRISNNKLYNLNNTVGGYVDRSNNTTKVNTLDTTTNFTLDKDGHVIDNSNKCLNIVNNELSYGPCTTVWNVEHIPCPYFTDSTQYMSTFCKKSEEYKIAVAEFNTLVSLGKAVI